MQWMKLKSGMVWSSILMLSTLAGCCAKANSAAPTAGPATAPIAAAAPAVSDAIDQSTQSAMTPDQALQRLEDGNARFVSGNMIHRDYLAQVQATSTGQYPFAAVLACIDSRSAPEIVFDQGIGDLFVARIAGNYASTDMLGSLEFATKVAGAKLIVVLGHTECGAIKGACDNVELGNLTTVIQSLQPAVSQVQGYSDRTSKNKKFVEAVTKANVLVTIARLRDDPILRDQELVGKLKIVGGIYDISTGQVKFLDVP